MVSRRGASSLGCLVSMLIVLAIGYFGVKIGEVYLHFYTYQDAMVQQVRFAEHYTDDQIVKRLAAKADSLGLPEDAADVTLERKGRHIAVAADYTELVELPLFVRRFHFTPKAEYDY